MGSEKVLLVEDNRLTRFSLAEYLRREGYQVVEAATGQEGLRLFQEEEPDLVLLDLKLPGLGGMELLERMRRQRPEVAVIVLTAHGAVDSAVAAMKLGAYDYLTKPFRLEDVGLVVGKALEATRLRREVARLRERQLRELGLQEVVAESPAMREVLAEARRIAEVEAATTVLLQGESGVGKDLVARLIHYSSPRAGGPFVEINCAAIPKELMESELFGYEPGAFTGAKGRKIGLIEQARDGSLLLDEITEMSLDLQAKLLRVLETKTFRRLGGVKDLTVDVRFIAATNRDLRAEVERGAFREDLYWRLNVISLRIPPLRERPQDILPLAKLFLERFAREMRRPVEGLTPEAEQLLVRYPWPGNVRELRNVMERAVILGGQGRIGPESLPPELRGGAPRGGGMGALQEMERRMIEEALRRAGGNKSEAARLLGVSRDLLRYRMRKYGIRG